MKKINKETAIILIACVGFGCFVAGLVIGHVQERTHIEFVLALMSDEDAPQIYSLINKNYALKEILEKYMEEHKRARGEGK